MLSAPAVMRRPVQIHVCVASRQTESDILGPLRRDVRDCTILGGETGWVKWETNEFGRFLPSGQQIAGTAGDGPSIHFKIMIDR